METFINLIKEILNPCLRIGWGPLVENEEFVIVSAILAMIISAIILFVCRDDFNPKEDGLIVTLYMIFGIYFLSSLMLTFLISVWPITILGILLRLLGEYLDKLNEKSKSWFK